MNLDFDPANPTIDDDNIALYHQVKDFYHKAPKGTTLWVKPYGYARYIDVQLGFLVNQD